MVIILVIALILRLYGLNWDQGWHLHPDERMLIMVADRIHFFTQLNPDFFNYGSLPIYVLKGIVQLWDLVFKTQYASYDGMLLFGRGISLVIDLIVIKLVYRTARELFEDTKIALFAAIMYTLAFFPIQNTHFFIVDTFLNLFITSTLFLTIRYLKKPAWYIILMLAFTSAAAITTKATALMLLPVPVVALILPFRHLKISQNIVSIAVRLVLFIGLFCMFAYACMPYAFVFNASGIYLNPRMLADIQQQLTMNSDPFIFPYTLQYVGTTAYLYYIQNIFFWGLGPIISLLALFGMGYLGWSAIPSKHIHKKQSASPFFQTLRYDVQLPITNHHLQKLLYFGFYLVFFLVLGRSAVKFMRYMLPLYAPMAVLGGYGLYQLSSLVHRAIKPRLTIIPFIIGAIALWTLMFVRIYSTEHTRISASRWVYEQIPAGATIATEHWDDRLPLPLYPDQFQHVELPLYEPDTPMKWDMVDTALEKADYIIIASNRLYVPLMKMTDCTKLPQHRCFKKTAQYYQDLFAGKRGFTKVAEFASNPSFGIRPWKWEIDDQSADESFTVYDHPKIMIFRKQ